MKAFGLAILVLVVVAMGQKAVTKATNDTLVAQKQVTVPAQVVRPSERAVIDSVMVNDSIRVMCYKNGKEIVKWTYRNRRQPLDTANITRGVLSVYFDDFSK